MLHSCRIPTLVVASLISCVFWAASCRAQDSNDMPKPLATQRLVTQQPSSGQFVETELGFMVPYAGRIPGTIITFAMVPVPGSNTEGKRSDWIEPFWIGKYEVSLAEYREYMRTYDTFRHLERDKKRVIAPENEVAAVSAPTAIYDPDFRFGFAEAPEFRSGKRAPATSMSQFAARQYTKWLSLIGDVQYRLPCEVEWERACRAGTKTTWSFGNDESVATEYAHFEHDSPEQPIPIGSLKPNAWGIHDMHGNVSEWVVQRKHLRDGVALFREQSKNQPQVNRDLWAKQQAAAFKQWILKGGDWTKSIDQCRVTIRENATEELWDFDPSFPHSPTWMASHDVSRIGFRIVSPLRAMPQDEIEKYWGPDTAYLADSEHANVEGGRGVRGLVDKKLPVIVREYSARDRRR